MFNTQTFRCQQGITAAKNHSENDRQIIFEIVLHILEVLLRGFLPSKEHIAFITKNCSLILLLPV